MDAVSRRIFVERADINAFFHRSIMSWYDVYDSVYDNADVQRETRSQAAAMTGIVTAVLIVSIAAFLLGIDGPLPFWLGLGLALTAWGAFGGWVLRRHAKLRRVVWCVKLSNEDVVGYDYARRRITIAWSDVERVEVGEDSLTIIGPDQASLEITHLFATFAQVSHRVMRYADRHDVHVFVDGRPWEQIDVYQVFPFLSEDASSPQRGSTAA